MAPPRPPSSSRAIWACAWALPYSVAADCKCSPRRGQSKVALTGGGGDCKPRPPYCRHPAREAPRMTDVTVLMTVYNGMPYLPLAVDSILNQTLDDFRFIIVDDGSTDGTEKYLAGIADSRLLVLR